MGSDSHTPPLHVFDSSCQSEREGWPHFSIGPDEFETVAAVRPGCGEALDRGIDYRALAQMMAAAPCMKEALEDLLDEIISHMRAEGWSSYEIEQRPYIIKARAILSKAGGQSK